MKYLITLILLLVLLPVPVSGLVVIWTQEYDNITGDDLPWGIVVDQNENVYITGEREIIVDTDYFTVKYSNNGALAWTQEFQGPVAAGDSAYGGIVLDNSNRIYVTGYVFNGANSDTYTFKYDMSGTTLRTQIYNAGRDEAGYGIAADVQGNIYLAISKDNGKDHDFFIAKYDPSGITLWTQTYDSGTNEVPYGIAVDKDQNVYVTGNTFNGTDLDYLTLKLDPSGTTLWTQQYNGGDGNDIGMDIVVDSDNNVYVAGFILDGADSDYYVIKYNSAGQTIWARQYDSGNGFDQANDVTADSDNNVYVTGSMNNGINQDIYTIKYDSDGNTIWSRQHGRTVGGLADEIGTGITIDQKNNVYVTSAKELFGKAYFTIKYLQPPNKPLLQSLSLESENSIQLTWKDQVNEDGYIIYRSTDAINFQPLINLGQDSTSYTDSNIDFNTVYYYRIISTNAAGNSIPSATLQTGSTEISSLDNIIIAPNPFKPFSQARDNIIIYNLPLEVQTEFKNPDGSTYKVTGFDFTIPSNMGRKGIVSGEWTAQMIGALKIMAAHYNGKDFKKFQYYNEKARFYESELLKMKIGDALPYASKANERTGHGWRTPRGDSMQALASTAYFVLSSTGYNPFTGETVSQPEL